MPFYLLRASERQLAHCGRHWCGDSGSGLPTSACCCALHGGTHRRRVDAKHSERGIPSRGPQQSRALASAPLILATDTVPRSDRLSWLLGRFRKSLVYHDSKRPARDDTAAKRLHHLICMVDQLYSPWTSEWHSRFRSLKCVYLSSRGAVEDRHAQGSFSSARIGHVP